MTGTAGTSNHSIRRIQIQYNALMPARLVALIVAGSLTSGWLLASLVSPPVAELQGLPARTPPRAASPSADAAFTEQLHLKLQQAPQPPVPRRNPFVFGTRPRTAPDPVAPAPAGDTTPERVLPMPQMATGPSLRLAGIGTHTTPAGTVHTAVIGDGTTVHLVKVGETVAGYSVVEITDDSVTIANAAGARWLLKLK